LRELFELAEDSEAQLAQYFERGRVLAARSDATVVGHLQLVETDQPGSLELKSLAVRPEYQRRGVGRALVEAAVQLCRTGSAVLLVSTAAASVGNLRFYQRCGFRFLSVDRDAFTPESGYPETSWSEGIALRDRVWLSRDIA
jgi:GNAT superfamily N-acetyltransferase